MVALLFEDWTNLRSKMFEVDCPKCDTTAIVFTVDLERKDILTCDECEYVILILDDECRKQLGMKYDPDMIA